MTKTESTPPEPSRIYSYYPKGDEDYVVVCTTITHDFVVWGEGAAQLLCATLNSLNLPTADKEITEEDMKVIMSRFKEIMETFSEQRRRKD